MRKLLATGLGTAVAVAMAISPATASAEIVSSAPIKIIHVSGHIVHHKEWDTIKLKGINKKYVQLEYFINDSSTHHFKRVYPGQRAMVTALIRAKYANGPNKVQFQNHKYLITLIKDRRKK